MQLICVDVGIQIICLDHSEWHSTRQTWQQLLITLVGQDPMSLGTQWAALLQQL
jgi:hypothetical protein